MITTTTADKALKSYYIDVIKNQLNNNSNPFYNVIKNTDKCVNGSKIVKLAPYGLNGGFGFGSDNDKLPKAGGNNYEEFVTTVKDMYGVIEISDKAIKASKSNAGAFVDLLNQEMEGLAAAAKFNYSRALFTDGTGKIASCTANSTASNVIGVDTVKYLTEGMIIDIISASGTVRHGGKRITSVVRQTNTITVDGSAITITSGDFITVQNSLNRELTGLDAIFSETGTLYGVDRSNHNWMVPYINNSVGNITDDAIQEAIDYLEESCGSRVNYITCAHDVRRHYVKYIADTKRNIDPIELKGGFTAISYGGIPIYSDRHAKNGTMDLLNTNDFSFHYLADWGWLDNDGKILKQVGSYPVWTATLAKYGDLICDHPAGQARLSGITG